MQIARPYINIVRPLLLRYSTGQTNHVGNNQQIYFAPDEIILKNISASFQTAVNDVFVVRCSFIHDPICFLHSISGVFQNPNSLRYVVTSDLTIQSEIAFTIYMIDTDNQEVPINQDVDLSLSIEYRKMLPFCAPNPVETPANGPVPSQLSVSAITKGPPQFRAIGPENTKPPKAPKAPRAPRAKAPRKPRAPKSKGKPKSED